MADHENNCGSYHNLDCQSNLATMEYDPKCVRCSKIKKVIALRRKTLRNGSSLAEEQSAMVIANKLIADSRLTRGECYDREYSDLMIQVTQNIVRGRKMGSNPAATARQRRQEDDSFI